jgi:Holin of 3TMs, for gene-transfer release
MGFNISSIIGGSIGDAFAKIVGVFKVSPEKALEAQTQLETIRLGLEQQLVQQVTAQIEVDKQEAANSNIFVAGWRPFIGWICGSGLACQFIIGPLFTWVATLLKHPTPFPTLDMGTLLTLLLGMLGLGGMRTYEKVNAAPGSDKLK